MAHQSSHPALSHADSLAVSSSNFLVLVSRIMLGSLFLMAGWGNITNIAGPTTYLAGLHMPNVQLWSYILGPVELLIAIMLIFGLATRYAAFMTFIFIVIATAAQGAHFNNVTKNIAIMSGALLLFVTGGGRRYSMDAALSNRRRRRATRKLYEKEITFDE